MNADVTPMNADKKMDDDGIVLGGDDFGNVAMTGVPLAHALSAFIGVTSAFIGVSKICARITR